MAASSFAPTNLSAVVGECRHISAADRLAASLWWLEGVEPPMETICRIEDVVEQLYGWDAVCELQDRAVAALGHCGPC